MKRFIAILLALLTLFLVGCSKTEQPKGTEPEKETTTEYVPTPEEVQIAKMTLEEKVAQLFFIMPEALDPTLPEDTKVTTITDTMKNTYKEYPAGGIILFAKNIENPEQLTKLTSDIHALNELTPLIGVDEEGGSIARVAKNRTIYEQRISKVCYQALGHQPIGFGTVHFKNQQQRLHLANRY